MDEKDILSPNQAAYRVGKSTSDHIFVLHELLLEYRFNELGPRGGTLKNYYFSAFWIYKKLLILSLEVSYFPSSLRQEFEAKCFE